ncbi:substrate-binding periplasmic protein [Hahella ganghwensis]|uniref:substrate-binding periplasmic protein n=1 Tax=Hahella ganghwensis TaxID=286420 RepID=UPI00035FCF48|nr:transporter substrate-binding domain-containing protein [Hahella ganghwensis]
MDLLVLLRRIGILIWMSFISLYAGAKDPSPPTVSFLHSNWPPFEYVDKHGQTTGYTIDILNALLELVDIDSTIQLFPWNRAYRTTLTRPNHAVFTLARTKEREPLFYWVGPIASREIYLWKLKSRDEINVNSLEDVKNYRVGTVRGEAGEKQLLDNGFKYDINIHSVDDQSRNFLLLFNKRIDFFYGLELTTFFILKKEGYDPTQVEKTVLLSGGQEYYFGFNRETPERVVRLFQDALQTIKDNGTFTRIQRKYGIANP